MSNETPVSKGVRLNRFIPMDFFRHLGMGDNGKPKSLPFEVMKAREATPAGEQTPGIKCGVVVGRCMDFKTAEKVDSKTGEVRTSTALIGAFEASRFSDGATMEAGSIYLPSLFTEQAIASLKSGAKAVDFCVEISAEPNPAPNAAVVYAWAFHDLMPRNVETNPLSRIKAMVHHPLVKQDAPLPVAAIEAPVSEAETAAAERDDAAASNKEAGDALQAEPSKGSKRKAA